MIRDTDSQVVIIEGERWKWVIEELELPVHRAGDPLVSWRATIIPPEGPDEDLGRFDSRSQAAMKIKSRLAEA